MNKGITRRIREFFDTDPRAPTMAASEIAELLGVSYAMVLYVRRKIGRHQPRPYMTKRNHLGHALKKDPDEKEPEVAAITAAPKLSTDDKRELLTKLAQSDDSRTEARISAIRELHRIDESVGSAKELGPGPPLTVEDRVDRLALLIAACGPTVHAAALALAEKEWT